MFFTDKAFWTATGERAVKTFVQSFGATLLVATTLTDAPWLAALNVAGLATVGSLLTSIGSAATGEKGAPSLGPETLTEKVAAVEAPAAAPAEYVAGPAAATPEGAPVAVVEVDYKAGGSVTSGKPYPVEPGDTFSRGNGDEDYR